MWQARLRKKRVATSTPRPRLLGGPSADRQHHNRNVACRRAVLEPVNQLIAIERTWKQELGDNDVGATRKSERGVSVLNTYWGESHVRQVLRIHVAIVTFRLHQQHDGGSGAATAASRPGRRRPSQRRGHIASTARTIASASIRGDAQLSIYSNWSRAGRVRSCPARRGSDHVTALASSAEVTSAGIRYRR